MILYDADCGFCRWSLACVLAADTRRRLRPVALQDREADALLAGMDPAKRMESWHLVTPDGAVRSAGEAFAPLLLLLPRAGPLARLAAALPSAANRAYFLVARNRSALGRLISPQRAARARAKIRERE